MKKLVKVLKEKGLTIGSIESMTGGLFASAITDVPGASKVYKGSIVSYAVEEKINIVKVDQKIINKFTVVSKEVAVEMAKKGRELLNVDVCVSVTGNAGPTCEPGDKPVGEVHVAVATKEFVKPFQIKTSGTRKQIRKLAVELMEEFILNSLE